MASTCLRTPVSTHCRSPTRSGGPAPSSHQRPSAPYCHTESDQFIHAVHPGSVELGDDCPGELIGVDRLILKTDCCVGVGERQFGVSVFGGDWGVQPCDSFC